MTTTITGDGMGCGGSEQSVEEALLAVSGVTEATADREVDHAVVDGDAVVADLLQAVGDAGYSAQS